MVCFKESSYDFTDSISAAVFFISAVSKAAFIYVLIYTTLKSVTLSTGALGVCPL